MTFSDIIIDQTDIKIELVVEKHKLAASKIILLQEINNYKLYKTGQLVIVFSENCGRVDPDKRVGRVRKHSGPGLTVPIG